MAGSGTLPRMYVFADPFGGRVSLEEADDLGQFHVEAPGGAAFAEIVALLQREGAGRAVEASTDHLWVSIDALRSLAGQRGDDWDTGFDEMLAYARSKGWVDETGTHVRAHVVWPA